MKRSAIKRSAFVRKKADLEKKRGERVKPSAVQPESHAGLRRRRKLRAVGKKGREWADERRGLKVLFEQTYGVTTCEARLEGCMRGNGLGFAHRLKRRFILTKAELRRVALLCNNCHDFYELGPQERMREAIDRIIAKRQDRLTEAA